MGEFTFVIEKTCPICGETTRVVKTKSRLLAEKTDEDFCVHYKGFNPYFYRVWFCEHCGFAADEKHFLGQIPARSKKKIREFLEQRNLGMEFTEVRGVPEAVASYKLAIYYEELIGDRTVQSLGNVFKEVLKRKKSRVDPIRSGFGKIQREEISVADKELYIRAYLAGHPHADFREMLELQDSKEEIIVTFLVILELMKNQKIRITQEEAFGKIMIDLIDPEEKKTEETPEPEEEPVPAEPEAEPGPVETEPEAEPVPAEPDAEPVPESEPEVELIPAEPEAELIPEVELIPEEPEVELIPAEPEAESVPEETQMEPIPAEPEPKPVSELAPAEPEPEAEPASEEPEPEPSPVSGSRPVKRHLIYSPRQHRLGAGRYAFRFTARKARKDLYRRVRGNRIWRRKRRRRR